jgi:hypothetical protein
MTTDRNLTLRQLIASSLDRMHEEALEMEEENDGLVAASSV